MKRVITFLTMALLLGVLGAKLLNEPSKAGASGNYAPEYSHCTCLHNAIEKKDVTTKGGWAYITWTNPNLNGGWVSYHRVATVQWSPWRYVEWGWGKTASGFQGLMAYNAGSGDQNVYVSGISAATHRWSHQYDSNTSKFWFYVDGANYTNVNVGFSAGNAVTAGGEVGNGVESMNSTNLYDLRYLSCSGCGFTLWNGHVNYVDNSPYYNTK